MRTLERPLQLHIKKIVMEILMPLMVACVSLADVCSAVKICRMIVRII